MRIPPPCPVLPPTDSASTCASVRPGFKGMRKAEVRGVGILGPSLAPAWGFLLAAWINLNLSSIHSRPPPAPPPHANMHSRGPSTHVFSCFALCTSPFVIPPTPVLRLVWFCSNPRHSIEGAYPALHATGSGGGGEGSPTMGAHRVFLVPACWDPMGTQESQRYGWSPSCEESAM